MRIRISTKVVIVVLVLLIALLAAVMTVSAADLSGSEMAIAKVVPYGAEGLTLTPISGTDQRLISPWAIDPARLGI